MDAVEAQMREKMEKAAKQGDMGQKRDAKFAKQAKAKAEKETKRLQDWKEKTRESETHKMEMYESFMWE